MKNYTANPKGSTNPTFGRHSGCKITKLFRCNKLKLKLFGANSAKSRHFGWKLPGCKVNSHLKVGLLEVDCVTLL